MQPPSYGRPSPISPVPKCWETLVTGTSVRDPLVNVPVSLSQGNRFETESRYWHICTTHQRCAYNENLLYRTRGLYWGSSVARMMEPTFMNVSTCMTDTLFFGRSCHERLTSGTILRHASRTPAPQPTTIPFSDHNPLPAFSWPHAAHTCCTVRYGTYVTTASSCTRCFAGLCIRLYARANV